MSKSVRPTYCYLRGEGGSGRPIYFAWSGPSVNPFASYVSDRREATRFTDLTQAEEAVRAAKRAMKIDFQIVLLEPPERERKGRY
mgnify:CR=1 FL=1